ncbi:MAG: metallo-mystery pair system four-Cys motif protein [Gammaproteobacteria bacterium]|nr:metallo-mystery pair system four-Cys motif protein [Gammaproteobacteria bacterium]
MFNSKMKKAVLANAIMTACLLTGCGSSDSSTELAQSYIPTPGKVTIQFSAVKGDLAVGCDEMVAELGPKEQDSVGINDIRFFVGDLSLFDANGQEITVELDSNDFQYSDDNGSVALIDLTDDTTNYCEYGGTAATNYQITLDASDTQINKISFKVGVPQAMMKAIIANNTTETAPKPLNSMFWTWASGYRHFMFNFDIVSGAGVESMGAIHLGSHGCGGDSSKILTDKEQCDRINTPQVTLDNFNPAEQKIVMDLGKLFKDVTFTTDELDQDGNVVGQRPSVRCHASPIDKQPDCGPILSNFGIDHLTGDSDASKQTVFYAK